jgi:gamma-tubulin complex component 4
VVHRRVTGAALCNCLYRASITGFPDVKACFERLLFSLHRVMYNQMLAWVLHGSLVDQHGEFFIAQTQLAISSDLDPRALMHEDHGPSMSSAASGATATPTRHVLRREFDWQSRYHINYDMLPDMYERSWS